MCRTNVHAGSTHREGLCTLARALIRCCIHLVLRNTPDLKHTPVISAADPLRSLWVRLAVNALRMGGLPPMSELATFRI